MRETSKTTHIQLTIAGVELEGAFAMPARAGAKRVILPVLHKLTDQVVKIAEAQAGESGAKVTCSKGCDVCCRQMVPISPTEAFGLGEVLEGLDAAAGQRVLARFERAVEVLEAREIADRLRRRRELAAKEMDRLDRDYFAMQIACPFLEERACMIHEARPLACREFVVTSDPRHCAAPGSGKVARVEMPAKPSAALCESDAEGWLPLILAREFTAGAREAPVDAAKAIGDVLARL